TRRLAALPPRSAQEVRDADATMIGFSPAMAEVDVAIKGFLYPHMYRHPRVAGIMQDAERVVRDLFVRFMDGPDALPPEWAQGLALGDESGRARRVADFIPGMTDRSAVLERARHSDSTPW